MEHSTAKNYAKTKIAEYLTSQFSIKSTNKNFNCISGTHTDKKPSMSYDSKRYKVHCFSCNADYDIFDLYAIKNNLTLKSKEVFEGVYNFLGISIDKLNSNISSLKGKNSIDGSINQAANTGINYKEFLIDAQRNITYPDCMEYLEKRGISKDTAMKYGLGYVRDWQSPKGLQKNKNLPKTPRVIIPTSDFSYTTRDIRDELTAEQKKYSKTKEGSVNIFNVQALKESTCFVTEGEFDALSFLELGYNAVSLGSASNTRSFLKKIKELSNNYLLNCSLIIVLDNDDSGIKATSALEEGLKEISNLNFFTPDKFCGTYKDVNEFLVKDRIGFENEIKKALSGLEDMISTEVQAKLEETEIEKSDYLNEAISNKISDFTDYINASKDDKILSTGFTKLDEYLDGGLYDGLYILGAISSLGKTTFAIQIADYLSSQGRDVLYISLEMSRYEIMAKSISRHTYLYCLHNYPKAIYNAKSQGQILDGKKYEGYSSLEREINYRAGENYKQESNKLWIYEVTDNLTVDKVKTLIEKHRKHTSACPVVVIDYLQIITPTEHKLTEKQSVDQIVKRLKQISRDFKIPVLAISSLNRESYKNAISMQAFKESGGIEYSADVLFGLQLKGVEIEEAKFDVEKAKSKAPREIELKILKNRRGKTGEKIDFYYYPQYNYFRT